MTLAERAPRPDPAAPTPLTAVGTNDARRRPIEFGALHLTPTNMLPAYMAAFLNDQGRKKNGDQLPLQVVHQQFLRRYVRAVSSTAENLLWHLATYVRWHADCDDGVRVGECFPSIPTLAEELNVGEEHVRKSLVPEIENAGLVVIHRSEGSSHRYRISLPWHEPVALRRQGSRKGAFRESTPDLQTQGHPGSTDRDDPGSVDPPNQEENHEENHEPDESVSHTHAYGLNGQNDDGQPSGDGKVLIRLLRGEDQGREVLVSEDIAADAVRAGRAERVGEGPSAATA